MVLWAKGACPKREDVLCLTLYDLEKDGKAIPPPSDGKAFKAENNDIVSLMRCDTETYHRFNENKPVKKTLKSPSRLNERAKR